MKKKFLKKWEIIFLVLLFLSAIGLRAYGAYWPKTIVKIGGKEIKVLVADTAAHRFKGLSGKKDLGKYGGMLFVFANKGQHSIVMRDMKFSLDIVWADETGIIDFAKNVPIEPNKEEKDLIKYYSRLPSTLVLELPAGYAEKNGLKIGDKIEIIK